jgi:hypothetical protein
MIVNGVPLLPADVLLTRFPSRYWPPSVDLAKWWAFKRAVHDAQRQLYPKPLDAKSLWNTHARSFLPNGKWFSGTTPVAVQEELVPESLDHPWVIVRYRFQDNWGKLQHDALQAEADKYTGSEYDELQLLNDLLHILFPNLPAGWRLIDEGLDKKVCSAWADYFAVFLWKLTDRSTVRPLEGRYVENATPACFQNFLSLIPDGSRQRTFDVICQS